MKIDVVSDVICPWCYLGEVRLEKALAMLPDVKAEITFRPFFLDPSIPANGLSRDEYMKAKFGDRDLKALHRPLEEAGKKDGVPYAFEKITRTPNTIDAHRLIRWAEQAGKQAKVVKALFEAYWRDGRDVGDWAVLADIAGEVGMDKAEVARLLPTPTDVKEVMEEVRQAYELGITGVPTFIINDRHGISGAQEAATLADAIRQVAAKGA